MSSRFRLSLVLLLIFAALAAAAAWGLWQYQLHQKEKIRAAQDALLATPAVTTQQTLSIRIPKGSSLQFIASAAEQSGLPVTRQQFIALVRRLDIGRSLQAGYYRFTHDNNDDGAQPPTVEDVLMAIAQGKIVQERITFLEGIRFADMHAQLVADERLEDVLVTMSMDALRATLGITQENMEGLFLPETYFFTPGDSDLSILQRAHRSLNSVLEQTWAARGDSATYTESYFDILQTPYDALILASIVEKETGKGDERPLIASVFLNRLKRGMRLQADPTTIYGLGDAFDGNLTRAHLRQDTPYNTYVRGGLPPTPIALVGAAAIEAVLAPASTKFYYFVATGDGAHYFSKSLREHNNAVNKYQRRRKK